MECFFKLIEWSFSFYRNFTHCINNFSHTKKFEKKKQFMIFQKYY